MPSHINPAYKNEDEFSLGDKASSSDHFNSITFKTDVMSSRSPNGLKVYNSRQRYITVSVLCFINLINYVDRFTIAGILNHVQKFYSLDNTEGGLLQTSFVVSYMIMAPVFGYLGDRYSRKIIIAFGVTFWSFWTTSLKKGKL
ncbi:Protein spinster like protein [Argiope bruennichi]|uniref:Protein spinster like protein n=1 Tax=Argiope bruennichi TaxID=94029 RepID=A0A8T0FB35_ARGBR|nr:Protein spinster like protein [Argiope bruennichi]